ncbi:MAG: ral substrate transporter [Phenylobacterium sp.]|uniref:MFS transporter n=1 Tax=Phenylobacterium sp. TaxID=1871053 RepID=UPI0026250658|nr:MFS transporter [Phenylobacterium sp.]MDB5497943.1 ral substrate transporter [Phenylobacterium sp.]
MTAEVAARPAEVVIPLAPGRRLRLLLYAGVPILIINFAAPYLGLIGLPITFFLKNRLHLTAHQTAQFNLIISIPLFLGFVFGFIRDRWSPFGTGDRGHLVVFGLATAAIYAAMAFIEPTYAVLLVGVLVVTALMQFVAGAATGLSSAIGRHHAMTGQMSTVMNFAIPAPGVMAMLLGGVLSGLLEGGGAVTAARILFLLGAGLMLAITAFGAFGPRRLFDDAVAGAEPQRLTPGADVMRLLRTWAIYPVIMIQLLWQFAPGANLALQYHMANELHATDAQVGAFFAIFYAGFLPVYVLYAWLAQRLRLGTLLWIGGILAVPQMVSLLFIHSAQSALLAAIPMGLLGGIGQAAFTDLAMRSCPKGLEGTMMMLFLALYWISNRFGDLWGADLYQNHGGYNTTLWATIAVYALILPVLFLVPKRIKATIDARG